VGAKGSDSTSPNERTRSTDAPFTAISRSPFDFEHTSTPETNVSFSSAQMSRITERIPPNRSG
jgi:hypothetical protein